MALVPLEWRNQPPIKTIKIGVMLHDGVVKPLPSVIRAMTAIQGALEAHPRFAVKQYVALDHRYGVNLTVSGPATWTERS